MSKQPPQPSRFDRFTELKDGSGFTIPGCSYVFKFDRYGGWFDQHGNYYDRDGNPEDPPSDRSSSHGDRSFSHSEEEEDEYQRQFGGPRGDYDEDEEQPVNLKYLSRIAINMELLSLYPYSEPLRVHFRNLSYFSRREEVFRTFSQKVSGLLNLVYFSNQRGQFNGTGYFVTANVQSAENLIKLQGQRFGDREIAFQLQEVQEFLMSPLLENELNSDLTPKNAKNYVIKTNETKKVESVSQKQAQEQAKVEVITTADIKKTEEKRPVQVKKEEAVQGKKEEIIAEKKEKQNGEDFASFSFLKKAFPKKTSFKEWLTAKGFTIDDYKTVEKIVEKEDYAKIIMKKKVFWALNNTDYNNQKIVFTPQ